mmetsp:Transcript_83349/g.235991  ORF Transcript_83349/g.235991 Transcript_83349/m.235991 type:complete len:252 (-) Transcript_83349:1072-1827(-)
MLPRAASTWTWTRPAPASWPVLAWSLCANSDAATSPSSPQKRKMQSNWEAVRVFHCLQQDSMFLSPEGGACSRCSGTSCHSVAAPPSWRLRAPNRLDGSTLVSALTVSAVVGLLPVHPTLYMSPRAKPSPQGGGAAAADEGLTPRRGSLVLRASRSPTTSWGTSPAPRMPLRRRQWKTQPRCSWTAFSSCTCSHAVAAALRKSFILSSLAAGASASQGGSRNCRSSRRPVCRSPYLPTCMDLWTAARTWQA